MRGCRSVPGRCGVYEVNQGAATASAGHLLWSKSFNCAPCDQVTTRTTTTCTHESRLHHDNTQDVRYFGPRTLPPDPVPRTAITRPRPPESELPKLEPGRTATTSTRGELGADFPSILDLGDPLARARGKVPRYRGVKTGHCNLSGTDTMFTRV